ncbi:MAG: hypothetical protein ACKPKO_47555, partial [Candidatus Fonsibacter sp.]
LLAQEVPDIHGKPVVRRCKSEGGTGSPQGFNCASEIRIQLSKSSKGNRAATILLQEVLQSEAGGAKAIEEGDKCNRPRSSSRGRRRKRAAEMAALSAPCFLCESHFCPVLRPIKKTETLPVLEGLLKHVGSDTMALNLVPHQSHGNKGPWARG